MSQHIACACMCVSVHKPRTWFLGGVCTCNYNVHTLVGECIVPIHTHEYTTQAPCVCVVYERVCTGNDHTRCECVHYLYIHVCTPRTNMVGASGVWMNVIRTYTEGVCGM